MLKESISDLVLMDIQLPIMDGLTATKILKNNKLTSSIPVYALTAFAMKGDAGKILAAGCDKYIAKPLDTKELIKMLRDLFK